MTPNPQQLVYQIRAMPIIPTVHYLHRLSQPQNEAYRDFLVKKGLTVSVSASGLPLLVPVIPIIYDYVCAEIKGENTVSIDELKKTYGNECVIAAIEICLASIISDSNEVIDEFTSYAIENIVKELDLVNVIENIVKELGLFKQNESPNKHLLDYGNLLITKNKTIEIFVNNQKDSRTYHNNFGNEYFYLAKKINGRILISQNIRDLNKEQAPKGLKRYRNNFGNEYFYLAKEINGGILISQNIWDLNKEQAQM